MPADLFPVVCVSGNAAPCLSHDPCSAAGRRSWHWASATTDTRRRAVELVYVLVRSVWEDQLRRYLLCGRTRVGVCLAPRTRECTITPVHLAIVSAVPVVV